MSKTIIINTQIINSVKAIFIMVLFWKVILNLIIEKVVTLIIIRSLNTNIKVCEKSSLK